MIQLNQTVTSFRREAFYERGHFYVPGDNVIVMFRIKGQISEQKLRDTIPELRKLHPMIGSHIIFDESGTGWFVTEGTPLCPLKIVSRKDETTWLQTVLNEYWIPFKITEGPMIRFLFIQGSEMSEIIAFAQHSICDGLSLTYLLRDLMLLISDPQIKLPVRTYVPTFKEIYNLEKIKLNPLIRKFVEKFNNVWRKTQMKFTMEDFWPLHEAFSAHKLNAIPWELNPEDTKKLVDRCHLEKVSVNSALYCAILNVQYQLQGDQDWFRKNIMMPVNIRNMVQPPIGEAVGLFAGGEGFEIKLNWKLSFWQQVQKVQKLLEKHLTPDAIFGNAKRMTLLDPNLMDGRSMLFLGSLLPNPPPKYYEINKIVEQDRFLKKLKAQRSKTQIQLGSILTNLGVLSIPEQYGPYQLEGVTFMPPNSPLAEKLLGVVTYKNHLQGMLTFAEKTLNPEIAANFAIELVDYLNKILS